MGATPLSPGDREGFFEAVGPIRELIAEALALADLRQVPIPTTPAATSQAMEEIAQEHLLACPEWGDNAVRHTLGIATLLIAVAEDHLESLSRFYEPADSLSIFTPHVVLRSLLETCGRVQWLVDTSIGYRRRAARGKTETLHSAHWTRLSLDAAQRRLYDRQVDLRAVVRAGERMGFETGKDRDTWWVGERRPSSRKAIDRIFRGVMRESRSGNIFRHTSAIAHATLHGVLTALEVKADRPTPLGGAMGLLKTTSRDVRAVLGVGLYGYLVAAGERRRWLDWEASVLDDLQVRVLSELIRR